MCVLHDTWQIMTPARSRSSAAAVRSATGILLGLALASGNARAQPLAVTPGQPPTSLADAVEYLEDPDSRLTVEEVSSLPLADRFRVNPRGRELNFGNTRSTYWFRFSLANLATDEISLFLEVGLPLLDRVELYEPAMIAVQGSTGKTPPQSAFRSRVLGDSLPFDQRQLRIRRLVFPLDVPAATTGTYYLQVRTSGTLSLPLTVSSAASYVERTQGPQLALGIFYGILLGTLLYNLFLFISVRQPVYFYLVGHTLSLGLIFACFDGLAFQLWPAATGWQQWAIFVFLAQLNFFTILFVRLFVDSRVAYPRLERWLKRALWTLVASGTVAAFWGVRAFFRVNILWLLAIGTVLAVTVIWHARRHRPARIYALAWVLLLLAMATSAVASVGLIPTFIGIVPLVRVVVSAEVLLAAMAVAASLAETRRALAASEEKLSRAFQASPDAITITTMAEGRFLEVNDGFEKVAGYSREEAIGKTSGELGIWHADGRERLLAAVRNRGRVKEVAANIVRKSGEILPVRFSAAHIEVEGEPCLVVVVHDMTELEQAADQRERLIHRLEAQNAELERFTYTVSHDLKGPLISIGGFLGFMEREALAGDTGKTSHYAGRIRSASQRMYRLLDELLELSRIGRVVGRMEDVRLGELATEAGAQLAERLGVRGVELDVAADLPIVRGDRTRLFEVFQNLLENALSFLGDQARPRIEVGCRLDGEQAVCYVRDNGIGIDPRYHDKVFGLFERLDAETQGTGVGLALVKRIIEFHGGRVWVESEGKGHGTTFCFFIPAEGPAAVVVEPGH